MIGSSSTSGTQSREIAITASGRSSAEKRLTTRPTSTEGAKHATTSSFGSFHSWTRITVRLAT